VGDVGHQLWALGNELASGSVMNSRAMLEMAYETWVNVCTGWHVILNRAEATGNQDRIALARSKVAECEAEIRRIEALLGGSEVTA